MRVSWLFFFLIVLPSTVYARTGEEFAYPFSRVWTTTVRLLRVELNCPIKEKDREEGYFLFDYPGDRGSFPGSVEFIRKQVRGVDGVQVVIQVPAMPSYVERMILDRLERKLITELGDPLLPEKRHQKDRRSGNDAAKEKKKETGHKQRPARKTKESSAN